MKEPQEIKEGLKKCLSDVDCRRNCPYSGEKMLTKNCIDLLRDDALEYIENLEERIAIMTDRPIAHWQDENGNLVAYDENGYVYCRALGCVHCSNCGEDLVGSDEYACKGLFCPSCGAEMINKE